MARLNVNEQPWFTKGLGDIGRALAAGEGKTRLVGGAVRDSLIGLPTQDVDLATCFAPLDVMSRLELMGIKTVATGLAHGTVTAVIAEARVEITTLRRDVMTDGRRATIAYSEDWQEDAARRDFTINALYADLETGEVFDFFGGLDDLRDGIVRFIGEPLKRIAEDHLRILRFFRFHGRFGKGPPDQSSFDACTSRANDLMALSRERIADECLKLLGLPNPAPTLDLMISRGVFLPVFPEIASADGLARLIAREAQYGIPPDPMRRFAALLPADPAVATAVAARLKLSSKARKRLEGAARRCASDANNPRALSYWNGEQSALDRLLIGGGDPELLSSWSAPVFPLSGKDIIARGVSAGPKVAALLKAIEKKWVAEDFPALGRLTALMDDEVGKER